LFTLLLRLTPSDAKRSQGHSGAEINTIGGFLMPDLSQNPTVIFLLAGTNDINNGDDIDNAPDRLMAVVDAITLALPNAAVLVGTLPLNGDPGKEAECNTFNDAIVQELLLRSALGDRVLPVYMDSLGPEDMTDGLHPKSVILLFFLFPDFSRRATIFSDQGYNTMGLAWFGAFWQAAQFGWIDPAEGDLTSGNGNGDEFCPNNPGTSIFCVLNLPGSTTSHSLVPSRRNRQRRRPWRQRRSLQLHVTVRISKLLSKLNPLSLKVVKDMIPHALVSSLIPVSRRRFSLCPRAGNVRI
jgi:hypothetical protein